MKQNSKAKNLSMGGHRQTQKILSLGRGLFTIYYIKFNNKTVQFLAWLMIQALLSMVKSVIYN